MSNMYLNVDAFNNLFEILKNKNSYADNTDARLTVACKKKEQLSNYIRNISNSSMSKKEEILAAQEVQITNDNIISNLNKLKEGLEIIEKRILSLIVKKEDLSYSDENLNKDIENIQNEINDFDEYSTKLDNDITEKYNVIKDFFHSNAVLALDSSATEDAIFTNSQLTDSSPFLSSASLEVDIQDNLVLIISEKNNKVYLPYTKEEIVKYLETYPKVFRDAKSVIAREFVNDLTFYTRYSVFARFREVYSLIRNREMKSFADALKRALDLMFKYELNPAIVAGLKSEAQLDSLLQCLEKNTLDEFTPFKIIFDVNLAKK